MNQNQTEVLNSLDTLSPLEAFKIKTFSQAHGRHIYAALGSHF